jgi:hypothetical protein
MSTPLDKLNEPVTSNEDHFEPFIWRCVVVSGFETFIDTLRWLKVRGWKLCSYFQPEGYDNRWAVEYQLPREQVQDEYDFIEALHRFTDKNGDQ